MDFSSMPFLQDFFWYHGNIWKFYFVFVSNIDTNELCAYFSKHLGEFKEIYGLVEELNNKISSVLQSTSQVQSY